MTADEWTRIKAAVAGALERPAEDRAAYVAAACGGDAAMRREVESLLASHRDADAFLETPARLPGRGAGFPDLTGSIVGSYTILSRLGAGGMGEVYLARDAKLDRVVALKLLLRDLALKPDRLHRFHAEARSASSLNHPHILVIHDFGELGGRPFIVTEFVEGETLRHRLRTGTAAARRRGRDRPADRRRAHRGARARAGAPRHQARERDGAAGRLRQGARLRTGQARGARRARRRGDVRHPAGDGAGHAALHVSRTGARQRGRRAQRRLEPRRRALRNDRRQSAVLGSHRRRHDRRDSRQRADTARPSGAVRPGDARTDRDPRDEEGPSRPLSGGLGPGRRPDGGEAAARSRRGVASRRSALARPGRGDFIHPADRVRQTDAADRAAVPHASAGCRDRVPRVRPGRRGRHDAVQPGIDDRAFEHDRGAVQRRNARSGKACQRSGSRRRAHRHAAWRRRPPASERAARVGAGGDDPLVRPDGRADRRRDSRAGRAERADRGLASPSR